MERRRIGAVAAVVTLLAMAGRWGPSWLLDQQIARWTGGGDPGFLPLLGTMGQTVSTYLYAVRTIELLLPLVVGVALGVWLARSVDDDRLRAGLRSVAVGSTAIGAVPVVATILVVGGLNVADIVMALALSLQFVVAGPVVVTVAAAAGVTLETVGVFDGGETEQETNHSTEDDAATVEREVSS